MKRLTSLLAALLLLSPFILRPPALAEEVGTSAKACVIIDERSGRVLLSHQPDVPLPMASTTKIMTALLAIIPVQLLAYYMAVSRGCDVDKPRNLAKSVTVE